MSNIRFKFSDFNNKKLFFFWNFDLSMKDNINNLLEFSNCQSIEDFLDNYEAIEIKWKENKFKEIGSFFKEIIFEEIFDDNGISIINIIRLSYILNKPIKEFMELIKYSNTVVLSNRILIDILNNMKNNFSITDNMTDNQFYNIKKLTDSYKNEYIDYFNLKHFIRKHEIEIVETSQFVFCFIPLDKVFNINPYEFEKELEKYYNSGIYY